MKKITEEYILARKQGYRVYELDLDKVNSIEDCKKILKFLCKSTLSPNKIGFEYSGFEDVEEYFK